MDTTPTPQQIKVLIGTVRKIPAPMRQKPLEEGSRHVAREMRKNLADWLTKFELDPKLADDPEIEAAAVVFSKKVLEKIVEKT